eukprot:Nitzschia sp. Nitz4//scaffold9_size221794//35708//36841//NITZ4_001324-RA/size221794-processed-gene-0.259-mRNA-1//1//CDS//3329560935//8174//frame0
MQDNVDGSGAESDSNSTHNKNAAAQDTGKASVYSAPPPFLPNERVLCTDVNNTTQFYPAIVKRIKCVSAEEWSFFVHYQGWNSRWDRWLSENSLLKDTPENRERHLNKPDASTGTTAGSLTASLSSGAAGDPSQHQTPNATSSSKKRKSADTSSSRKRKHKTNSSASNSKVAYQEYCELPFTLLTVLIDESRYITRKGFDNPSFYDTDAPSRTPRSLHVLPAAITVQQVLDQYQKKRGGSKEPSAEKREQVRRFTQGLAALFDQMLPVALLYPQEVPQYESFSSEPPSQVYGCEYLLRLFLRLPYLLRYEPKTNMDLFGPLLGDLIVLLQKNRQACFKPAYREPLYHELLDWEKARYDDAAAAEDLGDTARPTVMME